MGPIRITGLIRHPFFIFFLFEECLDSFRKGSSRTPTEFALLNELHKVSLVMTYWNSNSPGLLVPAWAPQGLLALYSPRASSQTDPAHLPNEAQVANIERLIDLGVNFSGNAHSRTRLSAVFYMKRFFDAQSLPLMYGDLEAPPYCPSLLHLLL
jgi:hypothetical protein